MIYLIAGTTHTGKTLLAQKILEEQHIPYLSLDHLKMGLIRSGNTTLTVFDDDRLTGLLWPIAREMVKTAIENHQNLTIEGYYVPHSWAEDFEDAYRAHIRAIWLIMTPEYVEGHFDAIRGHANAIEQRLDDSGLSKAELIQDNLYNLEMCEKYGCEYILIDRDYQVEIP